MQSGGGLIPDRSFWPGQPASSTLTVVEAVKAIGVDNVAAVEGLNEIDNEPFYRGLFFRPGDISPINNTSPVAQLFWKI